MGKIILFETKSGFSVNETGFAPEILLPCFEVYSHQVNGSSMLCFEDFTKGHVRIGSLKPALLK